MMGSEMKIKLLVVDDEYAVREMFRRTVDWEAYNVEAVGFAEDGVEAVEFIDRFAPDIVLTDVRMPGMDGIVLSKWVNENHPHIKVIFLSAYSDFEYAQKALKYNVVEYLLKPVDMGILFDIIGRLGNDIARQSQEKHENEKFKQLLDKNLPLLREKYIHDVLEGRYESDIEELFKSYSIDLSCDTHVVAIIAIESATTKDGNTALKNTNAGSIKLELEDLISNLISDPYTTYLFNENNESIGIVFSMNTQYEKSYTYKGITGILDKIREYFLENRYILTC